MSEQEIPKHLGLILDGNRRWAEENGLPKLEGHRKGYENLKTIGLAALEQGVQYVSAYVFSTENWNRSKTEVDYLMRLLQFVVEKELDEFHGHNVRLRVMGTKERLSKKIIQAIERAEEKTKLNTAGTLVLCLNYGGRQELVDAVNSLLTDNVSTPLTQEQFAEHLYLPDVPDIDLLIRTSGEQRLSNFMPWRATYSELMFVTKHWPDFNTDDLTSCFQEYTKRARRFGV